jgi:hypothetical protein
MLEFARRCFTFGAAINVGHLNWMLGPIQYQFRVGEPGLYRVDRRYITCFIAQLCLSIENI